MREREIERPCLAMHTGRRLKVLKICRRQNRTVDRGFDLCIVVSEVVCRVRENALRKKRLLSHNDRTAAQHQGLGSPTMMQPFLAM